ncbi:MAG: cytochrome c biogenesis protein ResB [Chloroflexia bacterium]
MADALRGRKTLWRRCWDFLASRKVAVLFLLLALLLTLTGLAVPQRPAELDEDGLRVWQEAMRERYGPAWGIYEALGLPDLFHSPFFWAVGAALFLNLLACTVDRLGRLLRAMRRPPALRLPEAAYAPAGRTFSLPEARRHLRRWGYRWWEEPGRPHYFYGETPRLAPLGTLLSHLGLLFLIPALLLQPLVSRHRLLLDAGTPTSLPGRPACTIAALDLQAEESGGFLRRVSGQVLIREREAAGRGRTGTEGPLSACGVHLYLRSYGPALEVEAADRTGRPLDIVSLGAGRAASPPPMGKILPRHPATSPLPAAGPTVLRFPAGATEQSFDVPALALHVTIAPSATALPGFREGPLKVRIEQAGLNRPLFDGRIAPNTALELPAGRISFRPTFFLEVEAVHDPAFPLLLSAGGLFVVGSGLALLFPPRRLWARLDEDGTLWVRLGREEASGGTT